MWNGAVPHLWDALKMIIVTGLVGGLLVWKNSAVLETKFEYISKEVVRLETSVGKMSDKLDRYILFGDKGK